MEQGSTQSSLPEGWIVTTVGEIGQIVTGTTPKKTVAENYGDYLPFVKPGDLDAVVPINNAAEYLSKQGADKARIIPENSIMVTCIGATIGKTGISAQSLATNQQINSIVVRDSIESKYVYYFCLSNDAQNWIKSNASSTTLPILNKTKFSNLPIPLAPVNYQRRCVGEIEKQFTRLDAAVANLKRAKANLERYKASVLKAACEGRLVPQGPDDEPADQLLARILAERRRKWEEQEWAKLVIKAQKKAAQAQLKAAGLPHKIRDLQPDDWQDIPAEDYKKYLPKNDKWKQKYREPEPPDTAGLPKIPNGWTYTHIRAILSISRTGMKTGPFGTLLKKHEHQSTGVPVIGIENIEEMKFVPGSKIHVSFEKAKDLEAYDLLPNDVVVSRSGTVGEVCVIPGGIGHARFSTNLMRIVLNQNAIKPLFFCYLFNGSPYVLDQVSDLCSGSTRDFLNQKILDALIFPLPPLEEQKRIIREVESQLSLLETSFITLSQNETRSDHLRQSILRQAFSGYLVPEDPNDEPASALLARIKYERQPDTP